MLGIMKKNSLYPVFSMYEDFANKVMNDELKQNQNQSSLCSMPLDIIENDNNFEINAELPGVKKEDVKILFNKNQLTIEAKHEDFTSEKNEKIHRQERYCGHYNRNIFLPETIQSEEIKAKLDHGVLTIVIPKMETKKNIQINID